MAAPSRPKNAQRQGYGRRGATAVEMITLVVLLVILAAIAIPNMSPVVLGYRLRGAAWQLAGDLRLARQRAITLRKRFRVCVTNCAITMPAGAYSVEREDGTWVSETGTAIKLPQDVSISASGAGVALFNRAGEATSFTTYTLTNLLGTYQVAVSSTGRIRVCQGTCS